MNNAFDRLIKNHTRYPITLSLYTGARRFSQKQTKKNLVFVFEKFIEIMREVNCAKCDIEASGARFEAKVSGGALRGNLKTVDLCQECCIKYGWGDPKLDDLLEAQLMGKRSW